MVTIPSVFFGSSVPGDDVVRVEVSVPEDSRAGDVTLIILP